MSGTKLLNPEEILAALTSDEAKRIFEENGVLAAYLYGSVAKGRTHAASDVDVAVVFREPVGSEESFDRRIALMISLGHLPNMEDVDVVPLNDAPLVLVSQVLKYKKLLYSADDRKRAEFEIRMRGMYHDFAPAFRQYQDKLFRHIKERGLI